MLPTQVCCPLLPRPHQHYTTLTMPPPTNAQSTSNEANIQLALQAIKQDATLSVRRAAQLYNVPQRTLNNRRAGIASRRDWKPKSRMLT
ncbi:hypothetical protein K505DRAFT_394928 [Melanomma pulvis-pyrius CBS 109.77]|uniref:HTH psq-type domain-containing protein n=1 Tax=Melanomma pulvis-pyrius CBS 109.77 TaxID=1314802 RepID=A0A6A6WX46_9PLEO|nr:hypothetical protein K505DRAFT_394928 [Melanomma pulvis-pyrius CBS 109.77]